MSTDDTSSVNTRPVSRRLRFEILRRDGHTCRYCGAAAPDVPLTVDHVVPVALGGTNDPSNLVCACRDCNSGKGSTSPDEHVVAEVSDLALRMATALAEVAEERRSSQARDERLLGDFYDRWVSVYGYGGYTNLAAGWDGSIATFMARGLDEGDLFRLLYAPQARNVRFQAAWRYFCGCCWNEIGDREKEALRRVQEARTEHLEPLFYADPACPECEGSSITNDGTYSRCHCAVRPQREI